MNALRWLLIFTVGAAGCDEGDAAAGDAGRPHAIDGAVDSDRGVVPCDACSSGASRCAGPTQYEQCERGADGCARWAAPLLCPQQDQRCERDGRCCNDACDPSEPARCTPEGVVTCAEQAGCYAWSAPVPCAGGAPCTADGRCPESCAESCELGERQCASENTYLVCGDGVEGCWGFSDALRCPSGETCEGGACRPCTDQCQAGETRCLNAENRGTCERDDRGCLVMRATRCADACVEGRCVGGCVDACAQDGRRTCRPDGRVTRCQPGPDGCLVEVDLGGCAPGDHDCNNAREYRVCEVDAEGCFGWGVYPCAGGDNCFNRPAVCYGGCPPGCELGEVACERADAYRMCERVGGCPEWRQHPCRGGFDCGAQPAACTGQCPRVCFEGDRECTGSHTWRQCAPGDDGCPVWRDDACEGQADCFREPQACYGDCPGGCVEGERECVGAQRYRECRMGFDGCPRWEERACAFGTDCEEVPRACYGDCQDACIEGSVRCVDANRFTRCIAGAGGCTEWQEAPCANGADCFGGRDACVGACQNACPEDERACTGVNAYRSCESGFNGCTEWRDRQCFGGAHCEETPGACFGDCFNACTLDDRRCSAAQTWQLCVLADGPGCTEWAQRPCVGGANCYLDEAACMGN